MKQLHIMFVCSGNICRSPLAHRLFEKKAEERGIASRFFVESSGTDAYHVGDQADARMRRTAKRHGLELNHLSRQMHREDLEEYDLIFVMGDNHRRSIARMAREERELRGVHLFREFDPGIPGNGSVPEVPDPWYGEMDGFEDVWQIVDRTCEVILDRIEAGTLP